MNLAEVFIAFFRKNLKNPTFSLNCIEVTKRNTKKMNLKFLIFYLFTISTSISSYAQVARTVCNGYWNNTESWEENTLPQAGDSIFIEHNIRYLDTLEFDLNYVEIKELGELCGNQHLYIPEGSRLENYGQLGFETISLDDTLINYGHIVTTYFVITNYLVNTDGGSINVVDEFHCYDRPVCTPEIVKIDGDSLFCNIKGDSYEWYYNDELVTGIAARTIFPEEYGEYKVRTVDEFGDFSAFSTVYLHQQASIDHFENIDDIKIYPNPSNGIFYIENQHEVMYEIKDVLGKTILEASTNEQPYLDLHGFEKGVYFFVSIENKVLRKLMLE